MTNDEEREALIEDAIRIATKGVQVNDGHQYMVPAHDLVEFSETIMALVELLGRSEVPEPSAEGWSTEDRRAAEAEAKHRWHVEESRTRTSQRDFDNFNQGCINGFMLGAEWRKLTHPVPEQQDEPSDAQVDAALKAWGHHKWYNVPASNQVAMRDALRAASAVTEQGENR